MNNRHLIAPLLSALFVFGVVGGAAAQSSKKPINPATVRGFNPQPEPPGKPNPNARRRAVVIIDDNGCNHPSIGAGQRGIIIISNHPVSLDAQGMKELCAALKK